MGLVRSLDCFCIRRLALYSSFSIFTLDFASSIPGPFLPSSPSRFSRPFSKSSRSLDADFHRYDAARSVAGVTIPVHLLSFLFGSHLLLVAYFFYPSCLHINTPRLVSWGPGKLAHLPLCIFVGQPWPTSRSFRFVCLSFRLNALANTRLRQSFAARRPFLLPSARSSPSPSLSHCRHLARFAHSRQFENAASDLPFLLPTVFLNSQLTISRLKYQGRRATGC